MNFPLPTTCLLHKTQSTPLFDFDETTKPRGKNKKVSKWTPIQWSTLSDMHIQYVYIDTCIYNIYIINKYIYIYIYVILKIIYIYDIYNNKKNNNNNDNNNNKNNNIYIYVIYIYNNTYIYM
jgi:hypothetical protein